jgi:hypothetical protein
MKRIITILLTGLGLVALAIFSWKITIMVGICIILKFLHNSLYNSIITVRTGSNKPLGQWLRLFMEFNIFSYWGSTIKWKRKLVFPKIINKCNGKYAIKIGGISLGYHIKNSLRFAIIPNDTTLRGIAYIRCNGKIIQHEMFELLYNKVYIVEIKYDKRIKKGIIMLKTADNNILDISYVYFPNNIKPYIQYPLGIYTDDIYKAECNINIGMGLC